MKDSFGYGRLTLRCPSCKNETVVLVDVFYEEGSVLYECVCDYCGCLYSFDLSASVLNKKIIEEGEA